MKLSAPSPFPQSTLDTSSSVNMLANKSISKINIEEDQYTCDLQPISGNVLYCCKELMNFQSVYKRMYDLVVRRKMLFSAILMFFVFSFNLNFFLITLFVSLFSSFGFFS